MKVTVLGCGGSGGVPLVGGGDGKGAWGACDPMNPRNRRRRVSILVEEHGHTVLVDSSPDLREQLLDAAVRRLDAVLYTHDHADHLHGIDDLRRLKPKKGAIPVYGDEATLSGIRDRFGYAFESRQAGSGPLYPAFLEARVVGTEPVCIGPMKVLPFIQDHGMGSTSLGYRIGPAAYSTDVVDLSEAAFEALAGVRLWIVDCLRKDPHPTHAHLAKALAWIARVKPEHAILTHLNETVDYEWLKARCPDGVEPAYDGLSVELES
jgi:phosphoribosyl 1,2-cyclic phosphate phosphodiesterase